MYLVDEDSLTNMFDIFNNELFITIPSPILICAKNINPQPIQINRLHIDKFDKTSIFLLWLRYCYYNTLANLVFRPYFSKMIFFHSNKTNRL